MIKDIPQKPVAKVLWDVRFRRPASMTRLASIPEHTARHYIKEFNEGKNHERKSIKKHWNSINEEFWLHIIILCQREWKLLLKMKEIKINY